jgi:type IV fimbrial biogenesis protein FimT
MVCVAVLAVLLTVAVPSMQGVLARRQLEGLSAQFVADLQFARSAAVARADKLRLRVHALDGASCYLVHTGPANACACTAGPATSCSGGAQVLRVVHLNADERLSVRANVGSMLIDPRQGTVSPTGSIDITASDGSSLRHVVNILGRVRLCAPGAKVGDVPAC